MQIYAFVTNIVCVYPFIRACLYMSIYVCVYIYTYMPGRISKYIKYICVLIIHRRALFIQATYGNLYNIKCIYMYKYYCLFIYIYIYINVYIYMQPYIFIVYEL